MLLHSDLCRDYFWGSFNHTEMEVLTHSDGKAGQPSETSLLQNQYKTTMDCYQLELSAHFQLLPSSVGNETLCEQRQI